MAPQDATLHGAQDWILDQAEKAGCTPQGHQFLCQAFRVTAGEVRQGFSDTQQQIELIPELVAQHVKGLRTESRVAPLWEILRALPVGWRVALISVVLAGAPSAFVATVGQVVKAILEAPAVVAPDPAAHARAAQ
jgi:hypothetical protein